MNMKITYIALTLYALCYSMLFGTWACIVFGKVPNAEQIVTYIQITLGALTGHVLTMLNPGRAGGSLAPTSTQSGFARVGMLLVLSAVAAVVMMAGCTTAGGTRPTPAQVAAQVCPAAQVTISSLAALEGLTPATRADLAQASPVVAAVCAPGAAVDLGSLQALASTALPAMLRLVDAAGLPPDEHDRILLGLTVAQITLDGALMAAGAP